LTAACLAAKSASFERILSMPVMIRMKRQGARNAPQFMVVAVDKDKKRDGAYLERLGYYYPKAKTAQEKIKLNVQGIQAWVAKGAQVSETVGQLLKVASK
jgi:small subunit ribosomal protein S16